MRVLLEKVRVLWCFWDGRFFSFFYSYSQLFSFLAMYFTDYHGFIFTMKSMKNTKKRLNCILLFDEHYTKLRVFCQLNFLKYEEFLSRKGAEAQRKDFIRDFRGSRGYFVNTKENKYEVHGGHEEKKQIIIFKLLTE